MTLSKYGIYTRVTSFLPWIKSFITPNLARWESENATILAGRELSDDDRDGQSTFVEFAANTAPTSPSSRLTLTPTTVGSGDDSLASVSFSRYAAPSEVAYDLQWTPSLSPPANWINLDPANHSVVPPISDPADPFREIVTFRAPRQAATGYFRLLLTPQRPLVLSSHRRLA